MKKVSILLTFVTAISFMLISWKSASSIQSAVHIGLDFCYVLDGNQTLEEATGNVVITSSGNNNFKCKAKGLSNSTGSAVIWNNANTGLLCGIDIGLEGTVTLTDDWKNTVSASGNVTLQCKVHPGQQ